MIQRWQTLFLVLVVGSFVIMLFYPLARITEFSRVGPDSLETDYYELMATGIRDPSPTSAPQIASGVSFPVLIFTVILVVIVVYSVFSYKSRNLQLRLIKLSIFINIILIAGIFLNYPRLFAQTSVQTDLATGAYFPLISLVLMVVAHRYILKDEKLVRSADRLR
jgi:hypothetical protein